MNDWEARALAAEKALEDAEAERDRALTALDTDAGQLAWAYHRPDGLLDELAALRARLDTARKLLDQWLNCDAPLLETGAFLADGPNTEAP